MITKPASLRSQRIAPSGSVLVFVVVLISILAMLAATSFFVVRQGVQVSKNAEQNVETKLAADTGLRHAKKVLHDSVISYSIYTPEGTFAPGNAVGDHPWLRLTDPLDVASPLVAPLVSPLRLFADNPATPENESVPLSLPDAELTNFKASYTQLYPEQRFTSSSILSNDNIYEFALVNRIIGETSTFYKDDDAAFLKTNFQTKTLPRMSGIRGQYFIWVQDLDSKFYARSKEWLENPANTFTRDNAGWGLDTYRTVDPDEIGVTGASPEAISANWEEMIRGNILKFDYEGTTKFSDDILADELRDLYVQALPNFDPRFPHFHSSKELATQLDALYNSTDPLAVEMADLDFYSQYRAELEHHFTVYKDASNPSSSVLQTTVKNHPTALNINTASVERIAAALSQIPAEDISDPTVMDLTLATRPTSTAESLAVTLARRIVAKRPFLCRMDFEDFLAAHLRGAYDNSTGLVDLNYVSQNGDLLVPVEADFATLTGNLPIVRMIYYSMQRRLGPGYVPANTALNAYATDDAAFYGVNAELSLAQYLEIPGLPNGATQFENAGSFPNFPSYQQARFRFFFNDTEGSKFGEPTIVPRETALITSREFNNIVNSINGSVVTDDVQNQPVGSSTALPVITAGPNGFIETSPQGDDGFIRRIHPGTDTILNSSVGLAGDDLIDSGTIAPGLNGVLDTPVVGDDVVITDTSAIFAGANGVAETWISSRRPSYYSYINDVKFAQWFWEEVDGVLFGISSGPAFSANHMRDPSLGAVSVNVPGYGPELIPAADRLASRTMRLYYRMTITPGTMGPPLRPPEVSRVDTKLSHLVTWRCNPQGMPSVDPTDPLYSSDFDSETRPGFYQMTFDEWTVYSGYTTFEHGPMQCSGDPDLFNLGIDDTDVFQSYYSNAKPWSGRTAGGPIDADQDGVIGAGEDGLGNGDISWSPKFAFRSRFFSIFVLGQGMAGPGQHLNTEDPNPAVEAANKAKKFDEELNKLRPQGEKRIEAVYDALLDQIIWQRSPVTDKRAMGEPLPP